MSNLSSRIAYCRTYPGLGVCRVGNSPDQYFIGPEAPGRPPDPRGGFKDKEGRIKRQAARFRVYAYDKNGNVIQELTAKDAKITWTVHLANRKAYGNMFLTAYWKQQCPQFVKTNPDHEPPRNQAVKEEKERRRRLIIDPGKRSISGPSQEGGPYRFDNGTFGPMPYTVVTDENRACLSGYNNGYLGVPYQQPQFDPPELPPKGCKWNPGGLLEPVAESRVIEVPLGALRTDAEGRLLVLGGFGNAGSLIPDNELGFLNTELYFVNNDYWFDDTSDGPVTAEVVIDGTPIEVKGQSWVLVAPPKFAPACDTITTLYDIATEVAESKFGADGKSPKGTAGGTTQPEPPLSFTRDIFPILSRLYNYQWLNAEVYRGHGTGTGGGGFLDTVGNPSVGGPGPFMLLKNPSKSRDKARQAREHVFDRLRPPLPGSQIWDKDGKETETARKYANEFYMPQMSGDGDNAINANTEESALWADFGGTYVTWLTLSPKQYRQMRRWRRGDFVDDWPQGQDPRRPLPARRFAEIPVAEQPHALDRAALEACVGAAFCPGIEMTYIARHSGTWSEPYRINPKFKPGDLTKHMALPWQADFSECAKEGAQAGWWPAARPDDVVSEKEYRQLMETFDPEVDGSLAQALAFREPWTRGIAQTSPFRDQEMVRSWSELGFVLPVTAPNDEVVYIETERSPYAGRELRDFFYYLMNIDSYPDFLPRARKLVDEFLAEGWANQEEADPDERWKFFEYSREAFNARLDQIYNNFVHDSESGQLEGRALSQTREQQVFQTLQMAPFNQLDGAWLRHTTPPGPLDEVHMLLFSIYMDELGDGDPAQNHANVYTDLLKSVDIYLPDLHTRAYADYAGFLDAAFPLPVFILAISQFADEFLPEILGMTLMLEWEAVSLVPIVDRFKSYGLDPIYYTLHVGIDNADSGHGALAKQAVEIYLDQVREKEGEAAMQAAWRRIWDGYVTFGTLGNLGQEVQRHFDTSGDDLESRMEAMIERKKIYGRFNHRHKMVGENRINDWFDDPRGFLDALIKAGYVVPGKPEVSPIFHLTSFNGPMYHVFTPDELTLWRSWILWLPHKGKETKEHYDVFPQMVYVLSTMAERQQGNPGHQPLLEGPDPKDGRKTLNQPIGWWFDLDLGSDEANAAALMKALRVEENGWVKRTKPSASPLVTSMLAGNGDMARAMRGTMPDGSGMSFTNVIVKWIQNDCPVKPEKPTPLARPKKRKRIWGMGWVH